jgi:hypothetical protein
VGGPAGEPDALDLADDADRGWPGLDPHHEANNRQPEIQLLAIAEATELLGTWPDPAREIGRSDAGGRAWQQ